MKWLIKVYYIKAIDEHGCILPYKIRKTKVFNDRKSYNKYIKKTTLTIKRKYGEKSTIDITKTEYEG